MTSDKSEGDGATPVGQFPLRKVMYRADKLPKPTTPLPSSIIQKDSGWCDDVHDLAYNKEISLPYPASHESLSRSDDLYDIVIPLGYNDDPVVLGKGSAIFMHVASENYSPTEGCVALALSDLIEILREVSTETKIHIML